VGFDPPEGEEQKAKALVTSRASFAVREGCGAWCWSLLGHHVDSDDGHIEKEAFGESSVGCFRARQACTHAHPTPQPGTETVLLRHATLPLDGCASAVCLFLGASRPLPGEETSPPPLSHAHSTLKHSRKGSPQPSQVHLAIAYVLIKHLACSYAQRFHC